MPKLRTHLPKMCRHHRGQAFVKIDGEQIWLGPYGTQQAQEAYDRLIAEWLSHGRKLPLRTAPASDGSPAQITVRQVIAEYWRWAKARYTSGNLAGAKAALRVLDKLYGSEPAEALGPRRLRVVRDEMVRAGWKRVSINKQISRIRSVIKWAVAQELIEPAVYQRLQAVEPLKKGEAEEGEKVKPVPREHIRRVRPYLSRPVRALVALQLLTASRADQLVKLRPCDIDQSGEVWQIRPEHHKTAHHDRELVILFGPKAQRILRLFMIGRETDQYLFRPREAHGELRRRRAKGSRRPDQKPTPRKSDRTIGECYTTSSYRRQIHRACRRAFPPPPELTGNERERWHKQYRWSPHRLRHNAATILRREYGVETAAIILGHASVDVTEIYAEKNLKRAMEVMREVG